MKTLEKKLEEKNIAVSENNSTETTENDTAVTAEITENVDNVIDYSVESTAKRIQPFLNNISENKLQISFEIYNFKKIHKDNKKELNALKDATGLQREQFRKMQVVGEYCMTTSPNCHACGNYKNLGFEKIYRISLLERENLCVDLENFAIEKKLSVRRLDKIVKKLKQDERLTIEEAYELVISEADEEIDENNQSQEPDINLPTDEKNIVELKKTLEEKEKEIEDLKQSNDAKDKKIKQLEERNKQLEQELKEHKLLLLPQEEVPDDTKIQSNTHIVESVAKEEAVNLESDKKDLSALDNKANVNDNPSDDSFNRPKEYASSN